MHKFKISCKSKILEENEFIFIRLTNERQIVKTTIGHKKQIFLLITTKLLMLGAMTRTQKIPVKNDIDPNPNKLKLSKIIEKKYMYKARF